MIGNNDDPTIGLLSRTLGQTSVRAAVTASNLANVDTPGYRAMRAEFPELLGKLGRGLEPMRTDPGHLGGSADAQRNALISEAPFERMRPDGNTVDVDHEMTRLVAQTGRYRTAAQLVRKRFALMRYAASDGRSG